MGILSWLFFGLIAGAIAKFLTPGRDGGGCILTIILGIVGALLGGWIATLFGFGGVMSFDLRSLGVAVLGAILLLVLYGRCRGGGGRSGARTDTDEHGPSRTKFCLRSVFVRVSPCSSVCPCSPQGPPRLPQQVRRLGEDQRLHRQLHRLGRAGEEEQRPGADQAGGGAAEHRRRLHLLVGEHPEELAEAVDATDRTGAPRASRVTSRGEKPVPPVVTTTSTSGRASIRRTASRMAATSSRTRVESTSRWPAASDQLADRVAAGIVPLSPAVAHGEDGEAENARRRPAVLIDARFSRFRTHLSEG